MCADTALDHRVVGQGILKMPTEYTIPPTCSVRPMQVAGLGTLYSHVINICACHRNPCFSQLQVSHCLAVVHVFLHVTEFLAGRPLVFVSDNLLH